MITRKNLFCTLALGEKYAKIARYLVADFADYSQQILILTDCARVFKRFKNAIVVHYRPTFFSYHDKRLALIEALKLAETAIFIDSDCVLRFGLKPETVRKAFAFRFPPGFHAWKVSSIANAGVYVYPEKEALARKWVLKFDRDRITYQEMLFALTKENGKENKFFVLWDKFEKEATARQDPGAGEGTCMGIAAQGSGLTCHDSQYFDVSMLSRLFWHARLDYRKRAVQKLNFGVKRLLGLTQDPDLTLPAM